MGGAANVASSILAVAQLKANINVRGFIPLCENMPGNKGKIFFCSMYLITCSSFIDCFIHTATKPGDVIVGRNGKSVCIDNTDAE